MLTDKFASLLCHVQIDNHWLVMGNHLGDGYSRNTVMSLASVQQNLPFSFAEIVGRCNNPTMSSLLMTPTHYALQNKQFKASSQIGSSLHLFYKPQH